MLNLSATPGSCFGRWMGSLLPSCTADPQSGWNCEWRDCLLLISGLWTGGMSGSQSCRQWHSILHIARKILYWEHRNKPHRNMKLASLAVHVIIPTVNIRMPFDFIDAESRSEWLIFLQRIPSRVRYVHLFALIAKDDLLLRSVWIVLAFNFE